MPLQPLKVDKFLRQCSENCHKSEQGFQELEKVFGKKEIIPEEYAMKPFLCYIGIHRYKDKIHIGKCGSTGLPFTSIQTCGCGKTRYSIKGFIELPEADKHMIETIVPCKTCHEHPCTCKRKEIK